MSKFVKVACAHVIADLADRFYVLDITTKEKALRLIRIYASDSHAQRPDLFRRIEPFLRHLIE